MAFEDLIGRDPGVLRRRVAIVTRPDLGQGGEARAVVEDDFHHFRVVLRHRDGVVTEAFSESPRFPTTLCPVAGQRLSELVGMALNESSVAVMRQTDARQQCTHTIDLAGLAVACAYRGIARRTYEIAVPDRVHGKTSPTLLRNGELLLAWEMDGTKIAGPEPYTGQDITSGFTNWAASSLGVDEAEAALVLRRAVFISAGRKKDLDNPNRRTGPVGGCWVWQPERMEEAIKARNVGSTWDFTHRRDELTADDQLWLAFAED